MPPTAEPCPTCPCCERPFASDGRPRQVCPHCGELLEVGRSVVVEYTCAPLRVCPDCGLTALAYVAEANLYRMEPHPRGREKFCPGSYKPGLRRGEETTRDHL